MAGAGVKYGASEAAGVRWSTAHSLPPPSTTTCPWQRVLKMVGGSFDRAPLPLRAFSRQRWKRYGRPSGYCRTVSTGGAYGRIFTAPPSVMPSTVACSESMRNSAPGMARSGSAMSMKKLRSPVRVAPNSAGSMRSEATVSASFSANASRKPGTASAKMWNDQSIETRTSGFGPGSSDSTAPRLMTRRISGWPMKSPTMVRPTSTMTFGAPPSST